MNVVLRTTASTPHTYSTPNADGGPCRRISLQTLSLRDLMKWTLEDPEQAVRRRESGPTGFHRNHSSDPYLHGHLEGTSVRHRTIPHSAWRFQLSLAPLQRFHECEGKNVRAGGTIISISGNRGIAKGSIARSQ